MDYVRNELEILMKKLRELEKNYIEEMTACPPGSLLNNRCGGKPCYYHYNEGRRVYLPSEDAKIELLARKEFLRISLDAIGQNLKLLEQMLTRYHSLDPVEIINASKRAYKLLPDKSFFTNQHGYELWQTVDNLEALTDDLIEFRCEEHREWANQEYPKNSYDYRGLHLTSFGLRVRSRGEIVISEVAHAIGLPFRHDQIITLDDGSAISPDFTFEDKYYEEFYIDYCGMMDDPGYVRTHLIRRGRYERNGINEWNNIRYIYSKDDSLNAAEVKHILLDWVVPKL